VAGCDFFEKRAQRRLQVVDAGDAAIEEALVELREHVA